MIEMKGNTVILAELSKAAIAEAVALRVLRISSPSCPCVYLRAHKRGDGATWYRRVNRTYLAFGKWPDIPNGPTALRVADGWKPEPRPERKVCPTSLLLRRAW